MNRADGFAADAFQVRQAARAIRLPMPGREAQLRSLRCLSVALCAIFAASVSHAQLYKWVDENGKTQYGDSIPPTSTDRARKELRSDGTVKLSTERAATAEEKRAAAVKASEDSTRKAAQDERGRKDKALLLTYSSLADYDRVRDRALTAMNFDIRVLAERETLLGGIIAANGGPPASLALPASATPKASATPAAKAPAVKSPATMLAEAKSELPRVVNALARKNQDLKDITALYAVDRMRLSRLIDAENAKLGALKSTTVGAGTDKKR